MKRPAELVPVPPGRQTDGDMPVNGPCQLPAGDARTPGENASDVLWLADLTMTLDYISPAVTRVFGYSPEEILSLPNRRFMTPESIERVSRVFFDWLGDELNGSAPMMERGGVRLDVEYICKDGSRRWGEINASALRDRTGRAVGIIGVTRDISDRRQLEAQQQRCCDGKEAVDVPLPTAAIVVSTEQQMLSASQPAATLLGFPDVKALLSRSLSSLLAGEDRERLLTEIGRSSETASRRLTCSLSRADGRTLPQGICVSAIRGPRGTIDGHILMLTAEPAAGTG